jgi:hypothetical protein
VWCFAVNRAFDYRAIQVGQETLKNKKMHMSEPTRTDMGGAPTYLHSLVVDGGLDPDVTEQILTILDDAVSIGFSFVVRPGDDVYGEVADYTQFIWTSKFDTRQWFWDEFSAL